jgi:hypothetical protein
VRAELGRFGPQGGMAELIRVWPAVTGEAIAANAWPARIGRDGTLHVSVSSSAWAFELTQLVHRVLAQLREALGEAAPPRLRFAVGPLPETSVMPAQLASLEPPSPSERERAEAARLAAPIENEELRNLVARAAAASLARAESDRRFW